MAFQRRRHQVRWPIPAASALSAAVLIVLLVLALLSFLTPPLLDHRPLLRNHAGEQQRDVIGGEPFVVPNGGGSPSSNLWGSEMASYYYGCSNASRGFAPADYITHLDRYLMIATSGGLNQQRTGITDAVVAARILNATLVVPKLDQKSFWKDVSDFTEIFDVDWFISYLSKDVKIIKQLPNIGGKVVSTPYHMRVPRKCTAQCYQKRVLPVLLKKHVVQLSKFDYRLANKLKTDLQKLRCRVNYHALKFTDSILNMGETLIQRMKAKSEHFITLHLSEA